MSQHSTTSSFWASPAMQERLARSQAGQGRAAIPQALNNLNLNKNYNLNQGEDRSSSANSSNLNNLKPEKRGGVPRLKLYTDETLKKAMAWGVEEWLVQVCIRDYGEYTVKGQINRIYQLPEGYFKPKYGPIPAQRGKLFNREMQKLKASKASSDPTR
jgi:hypothetical protein